MADKRQKIPEHAGYDKRLGRNIWHDERSRDFPAETATAVEAADHASLGGLPLNQADVGSCTAEATCAALNSAPDFAGTIRTQADAYRLYGRETADEGEPWVQGDPNSPDPGGSGLAVCKAGVELGWLTSYTHAFGIDQALKALVVRPNIWGVNWYSSFDEPAAKTGIVTIKRGAYIRGGHEVCAVRIVLKGQLIPDTTVKASSNLVGFWNSWGAWGLHGSGRFYMSTATAKQLLAEDGDVTVPMP